jgi:hypothetical protein
MMRDFLRRLLGPGGGLSSSGRESPAPRMPVALPCEADLAPSMTLATASAAGDLAAVARRAERHHGPAEHAGGEAKARENQD